MKPWISKRTVRVDKREGLNSCRDALDRLNRSFMEHSPVKIESGEKILFELSKNPSYNPNRLLDSVQEGANEVLFYGAYFRGLYNTQRRDLFNIFEKLRIFYFVPYMKIQCESSSDVLQLTFEISKSNLWISFVSANSFWFIFLLFFGAPMDDIGFLFVITPLELFLLVFLIASSRVIDRKVMKSIEKALYGH